MSVTPSIASKIGDITVPIYTYPIRIILHAGFQVEIRQPRTVAA
jgi:hypothetical protein